MTVAVYTPVQFAVFAADGVEASRLAKAHGYTIGSVLGCSVQHRFAGEAKEDWVVGVDGEDTDSEISDNLAASTPAENLSVDEAVHAVTADDEDDVTFVINGKPGAVVDLSWDGTEEVNKASLILTDGSARFTVGPYPAGRCTGRDGFTIKCQYADKLAAGVICTVKVVA